MPSKIEPLLERNRAFAATDTRTHAPRLPFLPHRASTWSPASTPVPIRQSSSACEFAEAIVERTVGGRVTADVMRDLSYIGYLVEEKAPEGPYFEIAIIHHTDCGSGLLADDELRAGFAERSGIDAAALAELPVLDPAETVRADVEKVLADPSISPRVTVSGHVYDLESGMVETVVEATAPALV